MALQINMHEAKTRLSELVAASERGEEVILARNGKAVVRLVAVEQPVAAPPPKRLGAFAGKFILPDGWEAPLENTQMADWFNPADLLR